MENSLEKEELKKIIDEIKANLTDDKNKNHQYLLEQTEKYTNHFFSREIHKEIGRLLFDCLSDEKKAELGNLVNKDLESIKNLLEEAEEHIKNKDFIKAKKMLKDYIEGSVTAHREDELTIYYSFRNVIEFYCFIEKIKSDKRVIWSSFNFSAAYKLLGYIAIEEKEFNKAIEYLDKAQHYNPVDPTIYFEKSESYKIQKDFESMLEETNKAYEVIIYPNELSRYYRQLGYYYIEQKQYKLAYSLYQLSLTFDKNNMAYHQLAYIKQQLDDKSYTVKLEESWELFKKENISIGAKQENISKLIQFTLDEEVNEKEPKMVEEAKNILFTIILNREDLSELKKIYTIKNKYPNDLTDN